MKLFLFAHPIEANVSIDLLHAQKAQDRDDLYLFDSGYLLLMGMGLYRSLVTTTLFLEKYDKEISEIINFGFCASLDNTQSLGSILEVEKVEKWIDHPILDEKSEKIKERCFPTFQLPNKGKKLISVEYPIHDLESNSKLKKKADLIDMEGYSVCYANQFFRKKLTIRKLISDFASDGGRDLILNNHLFFSTLLAKETLKFL